MQAFHATPANLQAQCDTQVDSLTRLSRQSVDALSQLGEPYAAHKPT